MQPLEYARTKSGSAEITGNRETLASLVAGFTKVRTHSQQITIAARTIAERKTFGHLSYRVGLVIQLPPLLMGDQLEPC